MRQIILHSLVWSIGAFALLAMLVGLTKGTVGILSSIFFLGSGLIFFPPAYSWIWPKLPTSYQKRLSQTTLNSVAILFLLTGIFIIPPYQSANQPQTTFANESVPEIQIINEATDIFNENSSTPINLNFTEELIKNPFSKTDWQKLADVLHQS